MSNHLKSKVALVALSTAINAVAIAEKNLERQATAVNVIGSSLNFDSQALSDLGVSSLSDLLSGAAAGLQVQAADNNSSALDLSIRGFGATTASQVTGESGVAVFVDGVYQARAQSLSMDILDLDSIEILRGPQGVLSGRNSIGGAVKLVSKKPSGKAGLSQQLSLGSEFDEFKSISHLNLPQLGVLKAKLSYLVNEHDGWVENQDQNAETNNNNYWLKDNEALRAALSFALSDNVDVDYVYEDANDGSTPPYFQSVIAGTSAVAVETPRADRARAALALPVSETDIESHSLTANWQVNDSLSVQSLSSYREVDTEQFNNADGVFGAGVGVNLINPNVQAQEQTSQEFRLNGNLLGGDLDYIAGIVYFDEEVSLNGDLNVGSADTESLAFFAQGTYAISDQLDVILGWRETTEEKTLSSELIGGGIGGRFNEIEDDNTDVSLAFSLAVSEKISTYLSYSTAFKSAGSSLLADGLQPYNSESVETIELGMKGQFWSDRANLSLVLFTADYKDEQIAFVDPDNFSQNYIINATEDSTHEGIELDAVIAIAEGLTLSASYLYLDADTNPVLAPYADDGMGGTDFALGGGAATQLFAVRAPRQSGTAAVDYTLGSFEFGTLSLHVDISSSSAQHFSANSAVQDARDLVAANITLSDIQLEGDSGNLKIAIWGKNLNNEEYVTNSVAVPATGSLAQAYGEPRSYGIDLLYTF